MESGPSGSDFIFCILTELLLFLTCHFILRKTAPMKTYLTSIVFLSFFITGTFAQDFQDVSSSMGLDGYCGLCGHGGGVSFVDFNGDGFDDLSFATASGQNPMFYEYDPANNEFDLILSPVTNTAENKQVLWVDYDNDGDKDLFITSEFAPNHLYQNNGSFSFTEVTAAAGLPIQNDPTYGTAFGDYNNDGFLDIYVANRSVSNIYTNYLYESDGDGTFTDVTTVSGTGDGFSLTFCSAFLDIDDDGNQDIYNSQDKVEYLNTMFQNDGDDTFSDVSSSSNTDLAFDAMNVGVGDYDNDGDLDIYVTNSNVGNSLLQNDGTGVFTEVADAAGVAMYRLTWGGNFFDVDNDMDLDLYVSAAGNGDPDLFGSELYLNDISTNTFSEANCPGMTGDSINSYANAIGDFNNDGKPDIAVNNSDQVPGQEVNFQLWENTTSNANNYLKVNLIGTDSNRDGIGSWIEVFIDGNKYTRYKHCGVAYLAQNSDTELIGLGTNTMADSVRVRWLSGTVDVLYEVVANTSITIEEGSAPLAVEWSNFELEITEKKTVLLKWSTFSETNNEGFEIQKSTNAFDFGEIAWQAGNQNTLSVNDYTFEDEDIEGGKVYYYRLKQIDSDGTFSYSKVISAELAEGNNDRFSFFPNPTLENSVSLSIDSKNETLAFFELYNLNGQQILAKELSLQKGNNKQELSLSKFPAGIYFGKVQIAGEVFVNRLIIQ